MHMWNGIAEKRKSDDTSNLDDKLGFYEMSNTFVTAEAVCSVKPGSEVSLGKH
jgi:hypothetical protein